MRKSLIIAPHSDDFAFSLGSFSNDLGTVVVVSPFDAIPEDEKGKAKHTQLNWEHQEACEVLGVNIVSGKFLDDVYAETRDLSCLTDWFKKVIDTFPDFEIYAPLGIFHGDHVLVRDIFIKEFRVDYFYEECPYYKRWQHIAQNLREVLCSNRILITKQNQSIKEIACRKYASQTDEGVLRDILVEERIWK